MIRTALFIILSLLAWIIFGIGMLSVLSSSEFNLSKQGFFIFAPLLMAMFSILVVKNRIIRIFGIVQFAVLILAVWWRLVGKHRLSLGELLDWL